MSLNLMKLLLSISLLLLADGVHSQTQEDLISIQEASYAMSQDDCRTALLSLNKVSYEGKSSQAYIYYMAEANYCLSYFDIALKNYEKYLVFVPGNANIIKRIAELRYKLTSSDLNGEWLNRDTDAPDGMKWDIVQYGKSLNVTCKEIAYDLYFAYRQSDGSDRYTGKMKVNINSLPEGLEEGSFKCRYCGGNSFDAYCVVSKDKKKIDFYYLDVKITFDWYEDKPKAKYCCKITKLDNYTESITLTR